MATAALFKLFHLTVPKRLATSAAANSFNHLISSETPLLHVTEPIPLPGSVRFGFRSCFDIVECAALFIFPPTLWAIIILLPRIKYFNNNIFMFEHEGEAGTCCERGKERERERKREEERKIEYV